MFCHIIYQSHSASVSVGVIDCHLSKVTLSVLKVYVCPSQTICAPSISASLFAASSVNHKYVIIVPS